MSVITQDKFCQYLNFIQFQLTLCDDDVNHKYIRSIIKELQNHFNPVNGFCEIENWIFFDNFGKLSNTTPEQLYKSLCQNA